MSDQMNLVEGDPRSSRTSRCESGSGNSMIDTISYFAMGFVFAGLIFSAIGFLYPRDITRDPNASARENEQADVEFMQLTDALNAIILTGMILIGLGGLILSAIFTYSVVCQECHRHENDADRTTLTSRRVTSQEGVTSEHPQTVAANNVDRSQNYGTVSNEIPATH